jgi:hypothetical protein
VFIRSSERRRECMLAQTHLQCVRLRPPYNAYVKTLALGGCTSRKSHWTSCMSKLQIVNATSAQTILEVVGSLALLLQGKMYIFKQFNPHHRLPPQPSPRQRHSQKARKG